VSDQPVLEEAAPPEVPKAPEEEHGLKRYRHGCRCDVCRAAGTAYRKRYPMGGRSKARKEPLQVVKGERPAQAVVSDVLRSAPATKRPTVEGTTKLFAKVLLYISVIIAMWLVSSDPRLGTDEEKERQVRELQLDDEQASAIAHPLARFINTTSVWQKVGPKLIEHSDMLDALVAVYDWAASLARYQRHRKRLQSSPPTNGQVRGPVVHAVPFVEAPVAPPPEWGSQVGPTPEQLAEIRRRAAEQRRAPGPFEPPPAPEAQ
jgi:hypothetical protein